MTTSGISSLCKDPPPRTYFSLLLVINRTSLSKVEEGKRKNFFSCPFPP